MRLAEAGQRVKTSARTNNLDGVCACVCRCHWLLLLERSYSGALTVSPMVGLSGVAFRDCILSPAAAWRPTTCCSCGTHGCSVVERGSGRAAILAARVDPSLRVRLAQLLLERPPVLPRQFLPCPCVSLTVPHVRSRIRGWSGCLPVPSSHLPMSSLSSAPHGPGYLSRKGHFGDRRSSRGAGT